jgi:hypothetical protein
MRRLFCVRPTFTCGTFLMLVVTKFAVRFRVTVFLSMRVLIMGFIKVNNLLVNAARA